MPVTREPQPSARWPVGTIFTVGHSNVLIEAFLALLRAYDIERLADIRTVPRSRHNPQFNSDALASTLAANDKDYRPLPALGGLRHPPRIHQTPAGETKASVVTRTTCKRPPSPRDLSN